MQVRSIELQKNPAAVLQLERQVQELVASNHTMESNFRQTATELSTAISERNKYRDDVNMLFDRRPILGKYTLVFSESKTENDVDCKIEIQNNMIYVTGIVTVSGVHDFANPEVIFEILTYVYDPENQKAILLLNVNPNAKKTQPRLERLLGRNKTRLLVAEQDTRGWQGTLDDVKIRLVRLNRL